ncbi:MAG: ribosome biogenesis factor YjgA [Betaproteobacteria bacterium]
MKHLSPDSSDPGEVDLGPSKTQRKREMLELQDLGEALTRVSLDRLEELSLPERLLDAIVQAKRITKFGALRRQLQYVGRLMRDVDGDAIAARLDAWNGVSREATFYLHLLERWRTRLLESDDAMLELSRDHPGAQTQRLRQLVRNARKEQQDNKPPRSYRELFQELRQIIPDPSLAG